MIIRLLLAGILFGHAVIHAGFVSSRPATTAGGPPWPFDLGHSWLLSPLGAEPGLLRALGTALLAVIVLAFAVSAVSALGILPGIPWATPAVGGAMASLALLLLFFHPWLVLGVVVDVAILWTILVARWDPFAAAT